MQAALPPADRSTVTKRRIELTASEARMKTDEWGIDVKYDDAAGVSKQVSDDALEALRSAIGRPPESKTSWLDERVKVVRQGESLPLPVPVVLTLEDGTSM